MTFHRFPSSVPVSEFLAVRPTFGPPRTRILCLSAGSRRYRGFAERSAIGCRSPSPIPPFFTMASTPILRLRPGIRKVQGVGAFLAKAVESIHECIVGRLPRAEDVRCDASLTSARTSRSRDELGALSKRIAAIPASLLTLFRLLTVSLPQKGEPRLRRSRGCARGCRQP
jgi:hypothetical protein